MAEGKNPISFRLTDNELKALDSISDLLGCSRTKVLKKLLNDWVYMKQTELADKIDQNKRLLELSKKDTGIKDSTVNKLRDEYKQDCKKFKSLEVIYDFIYPREPFTLAEDVRRAIKESK